MATRDQYASWAKKFIEGDMDSDDVSELSMSLLEDGYLLEDDSWNEDEED